MLSLDQRWPPERVGDYVIHERLGTGGMAEVFRAELNRQNNFKKHVAIKLVLRQFAGSPDFKNYFIAEARLGSCFSHPNLVQTLDFGEVEGQLYMVMEYVEGATLSQLQSFLLKRGQRLPYDVTLEVMGQLLEGLGSAHRAEDLAGNPLCVVHRDLKPSNLLLSRQGKVKLGDFGVARAQGRDMELTSPGMLKGTSRYMSPEQALAEGRLDHRSDLFSVGLLLFELLVGEYFYHEQNPQKVLQQAMQCAVEPRLNLLRTKPFPVELVKLVERLLAKDPDDRPSSAEEVARVLQRLRLGVPEPERVELRAWLRDMAVLARGMEPTPDWTRRILTGTRELLPHERVPTPPTPPPTKTPPRFEGGTEPTQTASHSMTADVSPFDTRHPSDPSDVKVMELDLDDPALEDDKTPIVVSRREGHVESAPGGVSGGGYEKTMPAPIRPREPAEVRLPPPSSELTVLEQLGMPPTQPVSSTRKLPLELTVPEIRAQPVVEPVPTVESVPTVEPVRAAEPVVRTLPEHEPPKRVEPVPIVTPVSVSGPVPEVRRPPEHEPPKRVEPVPTVVPVTGQHPPTGLSSAGTSGPVVSVKPPEASSEKRPSQARVWWGVGLLLGGLVLGVLVLGQPFFRSPLLEPLPVPPVTPTQEPVVEPTLSLTPAPQPSATEPPTPAPQPSATEPPPPPPPPPRGLERPTTPLPEPPSTPLPKPPEPPSTPLPKPPEPPPPAGPLADAEVRVGKLPPGQTLLVQGKALGEGGRLAMKSERVRLTVKEADKPVLSMDVGPVKPGQWVACGELEGAVLCSVENAP